jgi:hypothetical protein
VSFLHQYFYFYFVDLRRVSERFMLFYHFKHFSVELFIDPRACAGDAHLLVCVFAGLSVEESFPVIVCRFEQIRIMPLLAICV